MELDELKVTWQALDRKLQQSNAIQLQLFKDGRLKGMRSSLRPLLAQLIFAHVFLGVAQGAFAQARHYTVHESAPWFRSGVEAAGDDPYIQATYGEFWAALEAAAPPPG